jgi:ferredoxin
MTARSVGDGLKLAHSVGEFLRGEDVVGFHHRFNSRIGKLQEGEMARFLATASGGARVSCNDLGAEDAKEESARCLHCDCRKSEECTLRQLSSEHGVAQSHYKGKTRGEFEQVTQHADVIYEPGKCIKCGICVRITEKMAEPLGLTFVGRGFDVKVGGPFDESLAESLTVAAEECVAACPTAALSWARSSE